MAAGDRVVPHKNGRDEREGIRTRILIAVAEGSVTAILKSDDVARDRVVQAEGFEIRDVFPESGEPTWCEVARDGVILQFLGGDTPWPGPPTFTGTLYFRPESVNALYEQIKEHRE